MSKKPPDTQEGTVEFDRTLSEQTPKQTRCRQPIETRAQLFERLHNPVISLYEAAILLRVCAATVRRWADENRLPHARTEGGQRRFRFQEVMALARELDKKKRAR